METASIALGRLSKLEGRLALLEGEIQVTKTEAVDEGAGALAEYQGQVLSRLKVIREALMSGDGGGDMAFVIKERDSLREENDKLKKEIDKMNYRIQHLIKHC
jgi:hypothetical protein